MNFLCQMRLIKLINNIGIPYTGTDFEVKGISCNSKETLDNFVFVAVKGANADGNMFIEEAIKNGAGAVIMEPAGQPFSYSGARQAIKKIPFIFTKNTRQTLAKLAAEFYGNPSKKMKVIGITGTNGKTTISYLIEALIKESGKTPAVIGTINYRFRDTVITSRNTTPGPVELESMLANMLKDGVDYTVMEVSSHALAQDRAREIEFYSAIFTNLTQDHLDYHNTIEDYFCAKAKLFKDLNPASSAIINVDDKYSGRLKSLTRSGIISYGIEQPADVMAKDIKFDIAYTEFTLKNAKGEIKLKTNLIGIHNVYNILACASFGVQEGLNLAVIKTAIEKFNFVPGRLEKINFKGDFSVFVDYAHTEDALSNVIRALRQVANNRIIVVFGCGGERDKTKRPKMGRVVSELADYFIITSDNPRSEPPFDIINGIKLGIKGGNYCVIEDRAEAINKSLSIAKKGDIVLIAGKGHERYQILKNKILDFDDREVISRNFK